MRIQYVRDEPGFDGCEGLLAILLYADQNEEKRESAFLTTPEEALQVARMHFPRGHVIPTHTHNEIKRQVTKTQEVFLIVSGRILLTVTTAAGQKIGSWVLGSRDVAVLLGGGHSLEAIEETTMIEVKNGPYLGREKDKRPI